jgi:hypothetical protein
MHNDEALFFFFFNMHIHLTSCPLNSANHVSAQAGYGAIAPFCTIDKKTAAVATAISILPYAVTKGF